MRKKVADYIREARKQKGLSQRAVSSLLGGYAIAPIESSTYLPSDEAAHRIAETLELPSSFFSTLESERQEFTTAKKVGRRGKTLPIVGEVPGSHLMLDSSGLPTPKATNRIDLESTLDDPRAFAFRMADDSMRPIFEKGDILIASGAKAYLPGDAVFVRLGSGEVFCRLLSFDENHVVLSRAAEKRGARYQRESVDLILKVVTRVLA